MGVIFSLPFMGLVLGWFFVGAFITAPTSVEMMNTVSGYRLTLMLAAALGVILMAITAKVEYRVRGNVQSTAAKFFFSFFGLVIGFSLGFALPFLTLLAFAEPPA